MGSHRAQRQRTRRPGAASPHSRARLNARHAAPRRSVSGLPSAPLLVGVAALTATVSGAVTTADDGLQTVDLAAGTATAANAFHGTSATTSTSVLSGRQAPISRDSRRDALRDTAGQDLVQEAEAQSQQRNAALAKFARKAEKQSQKIALNAWQLPVSGYHLTARFGESSGLWSSVHTGLDFAVPSGSPVHAVAGGIVTSTEYAGSYGNQVIVTLDDGTEIWYCHLTSYSVSPGDVVNSGDLLGSSGSTGNSTGPHLHLEVRPGGGDPVDPYQALVVHGVTP